MSSAHLDPVIFNGLSIMQVLHMIYFIANNPSLLKKKSPVEQTTIGGAQVENVLLADILQVSVRGCITPNQSKVLWDPASRGSAVQLTAFYRM